MGWNRGTLILIGLAWVLAGARIAPAASGGANDASGAPSSSTSVPSVSPAYPVTPVHPVPSVPSVIVPEAVPVGPPAAPPNPSPAVPQTAGNLPLPAPWPMTRLPSIYPDRPVAYYSRYAARDDIAPGNPMFELPGVKLGWIFNAEVSYVQPFVHNG